LLPEHFQKSSFNFTATIRLAFANVNHHHRTTCLLPVGFGVGKSKMRELDEMVGEWDLESYPLGRRLIVNPKYDARTLGRLVANWGSSICLLGRGERLNASEWLERHTVSTTTTSTTQNSRPCRTIYALLQHHKSLKSLDHDYLTG